LIEIDDEFSSSYGPSHYVKSIAVSASNAQICVNGNGVAEAPAAPAEDNPFLAIVNGITVGEFKNETKVQRFSAAETNACLCTDYASFGCNDFDYEPVEDLCVDYYDFGISNYLSVDGLLYNTDNSLTVVVEVCPGSYPACPPP
jgi:hypothetical protein